VFAKVDNGIPHIAKASIEVNAGELGNFFERHFAIETEDDKLLLYFR